MEGFFTSLFRKEIMGNMILRADSAHPGAFVRSVPYRQYLRIKSICSNEQDFEREVAALRDRLLVCGYSKKSLKRAHQKACYRLRSELLFGCKKK